MNRWAWAVALWWPVVAGAAGAKAGPPQYECLIEPIQVVDLRSSAEGLLQRVTVQRGDPVRKGQVLAELQSHAESLAVESAAHRAQMEGPILAAQNRIAYATRKLWRAEELQKRNMVSAQARDEAETELRLAQSELQVAQENQALARLEHQRAVAQLAMRKMVSPFNGVVVDRMLNPGDLAEAGTGRKPVLKLAQIDRLRVDIVLPSALGGKVKPGAQVVVVAHGGMRHDATVRLVDKVVDAASGTLVARAELPNPTGEVLSGVRCKAEFHPPIETDAPRGAALSAR
jgi:RND family efflux transporter MFP subunit